MAVTFRKDLPALVSDLLRSGYSIQSVEQTPDARGKDIEIRLGNGVVINWDTQSKSIWAEGPQQVAQKTETCLRRIYEGDLLSLAWACNPFLVVGALSIAAVAWCVGVAERIQSRLRPTVCPRPKSPLLAEDRSAPDAPAV